MPDQQTLLRQKLIAAGYEGLYELLPALVGLRLGERFTITELFNVGGQSLLWAATDAQQTARPALVRMALLPYHRPAYLKESDILQARRQIEYEARLLQAFADTPLPRFYGLFHAHNPLQAPERGPAITESEPYLVIERIQGLPLDQWGRLMHSAVDLTRDAGLAKMAVDIAEVMLQLNQTLLPGGYLYADLSPRNLLLPSRASAWALRVVDAGSIVPASVQPGFTVPFTWEYLSPAYYAAYQRGENPWPTQASALYSLGKVLWQMLTARQPVPGEHPHLTDPAFLRCPPALQVFTARLVQGECHSFTEAAGLLPDLQAALAPFTPKRW